MMIHASAPVRIDIAGGTLDLWPLYLMLDEPKTVVLSTSIRQHVELEFGGKGLRLSSQDQGSQETISADALDLRKGPLALHARSVRAFLDSLPEKNLSLSTRAESPAGSGLGGSSALCIAIVGALNRAAKNQDTDLISLARDLEAAILSGPAGTQDHFGARFGGLQTLHWRERAPVREAHDCATELGDRILLFYSGASRDSGINNWKIYKAFLDGDAETRKLMQEIATAAKLTHEAIRSQNWTQVGKAIQQEWGARKKLAPEISTPAIDKAFEEAKRLGYETHKICGAGGGGCFFVFHEDPKHSKKSELIKKFQSLQIEPLPFQADTEGLKIDGQK